MTGPLHVVSALYNDTRIDIGQLKIFQNKCQMPLAKGSFL